MARPMATRWRWPQLAGAAVQKVLHLQDLCRLGDPGCLDLLAVPGDRQPERHVFAHCHVRENHVGLKHHRHTALFRLQVIDAPAADFQGAAADVLQPGDHPEQGAFAAARRADKHHEFAMPDVDIDAFDDVGSTEAFLQSRQFDVSPDLLRRSGRWGNLQKTVGPDRDRFRVHDIAAELVLAAVGKAGDAQAAGGFDDARGIAAAGICAVKEPAGGHSPGPARVIGDQAMGAGHRGLRVGGRGRQQTNGATRC